MDGSMDGWIDGWMQRIMDKIKKTTMYLFFLGIYLSCLCAVDFSKAEITKGSAESHLWKEITINYYQYFTWKKEYSHIKNHACKKVYSPEHHFFLRCMASSHFLRPAETVNRWHSNNSNMLRHNTMGKGFRYKETNKAVKSIPHDGFITGRFLIWKPNVRSYTFHNITTGSIVHINATPSHRFYVLNRKKFISIKNILSSDKLITSKGESIALLCPPGRYNHCGKSYNKGIPVPVYNLEVYNRHQYFVSTAKLLVHNCTGFKKIFRFRTRRAPPPAEEKSIDTSSVELLENLPDKYSKADDILYEQKIKGVFYRGDTRPPETIFREGFQKMKSSKYNNDSVSITRHLQHAAGCGNPKALTGAECLTNIYLIDFLSEPVDFENTSGHYMVNSVPTEHIAGCIIYSYAVNGRNSLISLHSLVKNERYTGKLELVSLQKS